MPTSSFSINLSLVLGVTLSAASGMVAESVFFLEVEIKHAGWMVRSRSALDCDKIRHPCLVTNRTYDAILPVGVKKKKQMSPKLAGHRNIIPASISRNINFTPKYAAMTG